MANVLILTLNKQNEENYMLNKMNEVPGVCVLPTFKDFNLGMKVIWKFSMKLKVFWLVGLFLTDSVKSEIKNNDIVVCMASHYSPTILKYISKKYNKRCINYFWDKISISGYPVNKSKEFENWTFDIDDANYYSLEYNPQFYVDSIKIDKKIKYDLTFVGADRNGQWKNRTTLVKKYYKLFDEIGLKTFFYYVTKSTSIDEEIRHDKGLSNQEFIGVIGEGKAILEIVEPGREWLTQRPFLALSNNIKLVTNNKKIKDMDFYSPDNIFILEDDNISNLCDFLKNSIDIKNDLKYYSLSEWKERF